MPSEEWGLAYNVAVKDQYGESNYEVFTMNLDGSDPKNISNHEDIDWTYAAFQKDLYFISDRDTCHRCFFLYRTDFGGSNPQRISDLQLEDSWMDISDDGKEIIVSGRVTFRTRHQLFLIDSQDGSYRQLTTDTAAYYRDPAFSPDGKQIAFVYRKDRRDRSLHDEIYLMNRDGSGLKRLTYYPEDQLAANQQGYRAGATRWHPSADMITYISKQNGFHNIFSISPEGGESMQLTQMEGNSGWHDWSPDGKWLTYDASNAEENQYHIMLMDWETKVSRQLTTDKYQYQQCPVFVRK